MQLLTSQKNQLLEIIRDDQLDPFNFEWKDRRVRYPGYSTGTYIIPTLEFKGTDYFYGFDKRSWGTWFQGEVTGGWLLFNNNQRNHLLHLAANPRANVTVGVIGGHFELVENNYRGVPVTDRHFGDELNLYTDWVINGNLTLSAGYGVMFPGEGAVQGVGDDETFHLFEMGLYLSY